MLVGSLTPAQPGEEGAALHGAREGHAGARRLMLFVPLHLFALLLFPAGRMASTGSFQKASRRWHQRWGNIAIRKLQEINKICLPRMVKLWGWGFPLIFLLTDWIARQIYGSQLRKDPYPALAFCTTLDARTFHPSFLQTEQVKTFEMLLGLNMSKREKSSTFPHPLQNK